MSALEVRRVESLEGLESIREEWQELESASPRHVLLDHRWVCAWWRHFGRGKQLHTLVVRRGKTSVGIAPLMISRGFEAFPSRNTLVLIAEDHQHVPSVRWRRVVPIRRLTFPVNVPCGNVRNHFLVGEDSAGFYEAIAGYLCDRSRAWDMAWLEGFPEESMQATRLRDAAAAAGLRSARGHFARRYYRAALPRTFDEFLEQRSRMFRKRLRQEIRRDERKAESLGEVRVRAFRGPTIDAGMDILFALEGRSWKAGRGRRRKLVWRLDERARSFHREVARSYAESDAATVQVLEVADQPVAAFYLLERDGILNCLLTFRDETQAAGISTALLWKEAVSGAIGRGLLEIDFNGETRNQRPWADGETRFERVVLFNGQPYSRLLRALKDGANAVSQRMKSRRRAAPDEAPEATA